jgi:tetratricopeptide (TPR) repeat protein
MKAHIHISPDIIDNKRAIIWNEMPSHHVEEEDIQECLNEARNQLWKPSPLEGARLGARLYRILNGSGGMLATHIRDCRAQGESLYLYIGLPSELNALPFEIIWDREFLLLESHPQTFIIRKVNDRSRLKEVTPQKRPLKVLFMACSPVDLHPHEVLHFEKEEERILEGVERFQVDITIEDSGSLEGLRNSLYEGGGSYDIVHITGHTGIDYKHKLGPVFYMEDETGRRDKVTPQRLWDEALNYFPPRLLFLSGCSTGKGDKVNEAESFAYQMIDKGVSFALGWGLPVSDTGATQVTTELYRYLGMGKGLCEALSGSRQALKDHYYPWPLLRLFSDGSQLVPFISPGMKLKPRRKTTYTYLKDSNVRVLESGFVGRRRDIQKGVRVLRGDFSPDENVRYGLLIRGPAGVGKSCLAGKLIERFKDKELIVIHGKVKYAPLFEKLDKLFEKKGIESARKVLMSDREPDKRLMELFRLVFTELPVIFYFDDFEQNLIRYGDKYVVSPESVDMMRAILTALDWTDFTTSVIITSRYPFTLEYKAEELTSKLEDITLMSFRDADMKKKEEELPHIKESVHKDLYRECGRGNPRLLEWLEKIAKDEEKYDLNALRRELEGKGEEFIRVYLAEVLARTEGEDFHHFLHKASVYRQPVASDAFKDFSGDKSKKLLEKGVDLTLFEKEMVRGQEALYWVMPVIREKEWGKLSEEDKSKMHHFAYEWYDRVVSESEEPDYASLEEAVYHGLESDNVRGACKHAPLLGDYLESLLLYKERAEVQERVAGRITDEVIEEAAKEKDESVAGLFNSLGNAWSALGDARKAVDYYEKALSIDLNVFGDNHPNVATRYNNLGSAWSDLGDARKAVDYYEKALTIFMTIYGSEHPSTKTVKSNMDMALQDITGKGHHEE